VFGLGIWEVLMVAGVVVLLFGHRIPGVARSLAGTVSSFKRGLRDTDDVQGK
jgi:sec-independent protein translocase protein TatA